MGIKGLMGYLKKNHPSLLEKTSLGAFRGKIFAVDVALFMYKFKYGKEDVEDAALSFINQYHMLGRAGISVIYVFDGESNACKEPEKKKRRVQYDLTADRVETNIARLDAEEKLILEGDGELTGPSMLNKLVDIEQSRKRERKKVIRVGSSDYDHLRKVFVAEGIPFCVACHEGEIACAELVKMGIADVVVTEDSDALPAGSPLWLRWLNSSQYDLTLVRRDRVLEALDLSSEKFLDFCILCGCDFCGTIPRVGPVTAHRLMERYDSLEELISIGRVCSKVPANFTYQEARRQFLEAGPITPSPNVVLGLLCVVILLHHHQHLQ